MTRKALRLWTGAVVGTYAGAIVLGIGIRIVYPAPSNLVYTTYKDLIPLIIALPAAFLAYGFQRRASYLQGLRTLWGNMVMAMAGALTYTDLPSPSKEQYADTLRRLSAVIEEVRGFFANVPTALPSEGWYPFQPVVQIYDEIRTLGFGEEATHEKRAETRHTIYAMWKENRGRFLAELDVAVPTHHHAAYARTPTRVWS